MVPSLHFCRYQLAGDCSAWREKWMVRRFRSGMIAKALIGGRVVCAPLDGTLATKEAGTFAPEWGVSLREAIQAAIENNVNVRLLKERIAAA